MGSAHLLREISTRSTETALDSTSAILMKLIGPDLVRLLKGLSESNGNGKTTQYTSEISHCVAKTLAHRVLHSMMKSVFSLLSNSTEGFNKCSSHVSFTTSSLIVSIIQSFLCIPLSFIALHSTIQNAKASNSFFSRRRRLQVLANVLYSWSEVRRSTCRLNVCAMQ